MLIRSACVFFSMVAATAQAQQELVFNSGFEAPVVSGLWINRQPGEVFGGWTVDSGPGTNGVVQVASIGLPSAYEGAQSVELNFNLPGGISQTLATQPNRTYLITFQMAGQLNAGPDVKSLRLSWGGVNLGEAQWSRSQSGGRWELRRFRAQATSTSTVIHFRGLQTVDGGPYIDVVSVQPSDCLADFNADGFLDFFDYQDFVDCFEGTACPAGSTADFNEDGFVDFFDYDGYVELFEAGC